MTLNQIYSLATDATFQHQAQAAALYYAHSVMSEAVNQHQQVDAKRRALAQAIIVDGCVALLPRVAYGLASLPGFSAATGDTGSANDTAINSAIQTVWNDLAGVITPDFNT